MSDTPRWPYREQQSDIIDTAVRRFLGDRGCRFRTFVINGESVDYFSANDIARNRDEGFVSRWLEGWGRDYTAVASDKTGVDVETLVRFDEGFWLHPIIARRFAQDCSPILAWWIDELREAISNGQPIEVAEHFFFRSIENVLQQGSESK